MRKRASARARRNRRTVSEASTLGPQGHAAGKRSVAATTTLTRAEHSKIRGHLRTLRLSLMRARDALMHFKDDRVDRDKLEPAARRVDDLMDMFVGDARDLAQGPVWVAEIRGGVEQVTNPKVAEALREARVDITALLEVMAPVGRSAATVPRHPPE